MFVFDRFVAIAADAGVSGFKTAPEILVSGQNIHPGTPPTPLIDVAVAVEDAIAHPAVIAAGEAIGVQQIIQGAIALQGNDVESGELFVNAARVPFDQVIHGVSINTGFTKITPDVPFVRTNFAPAPQMWGRLPRKIALGRRRRRRERGRKESDFSDQI
jgi:hypothetical protein